MGDVVPAPIDCRRVRRVPIALGLGLLGAFAAAVAIQMPSDNPSTPTGSSRPAPFASTMLRCKTLSDAPLADASCRAAWAEHRRRFLARGARP